MNRLWLIGGGLVIVVAAIFGWLTANREAELDQVLVLADAARLGCDAPGQLWLTLGNASGRLLLSADGVISLARAAGETPVAVGNFRMAGPVQPGAQKESCVAIDEPDLGGAGRNGVIWLARTTAAEFGEAASR